MQLNGVGVVGDQGVLLDKERREIVVCAVCTCWYQKICEGWTKCDGV